ncbi:hypothetical protein DN752_16390 [Echinicola strongylocentroti]|uniref:F5/8 type C domain-containing protein n=1 Tax=Echinicola strongylocentroti TaxID=1795355 RepID=A0A2Z4ILY9_9BACT|nr:DUF3472 domain-containing protein [Echinicola strongylocentroti]AWW31576.1 hypothetical protein DN752_16390 [Echinicola strongylocentroti]
MRQRYIMILSQVILAVCVSCATEITDPIVENNDTTATDVVYKDIVIPANKSYIEPWDEQSPAMLYNPDADHEVVTGWQSIDHDLVGYYELEPGQYITGLLAKVENGAATDFKLTISSPNDEAVEWVSTATFTGTGNFEEVLFDTIQVDQTGFFRLELSPVSATGSEVAEVADFVFKTESGSARYAHWLSSPSVHLSFKPGDQVTRDYDWLYGEINVPQGYDPMYTFYMCIGFYRGYLGIQVNSSTERRVLFSVWDSSDVPDDRDEVDPEDLVTLIDKGDQVHAGGFGNEGTGGQSYWKYPWETAVPIKFIMNVRRNNDNTVLLSAWFMDVESEGWKYMATWKAPQEQRYFDGFYSFLENFGNRNGQKVRMAEYYNMWGKEVGGSWINFNRATMTHTDGVPEGRDDYAGGLLDGASQRFYMSSGGYTHADEQAVSIASARSNPPMADITALASRVDEALSNQIIPMDKTAWTVLGFSSEEAAGEGADNGRAADAIDDNPATFWHSQWAGGNPGYPHDITLDLGEEVTAKGILLQNRSKHNGRPKTATVEVSADNVTWTSLGTIHFPLDGGAVEFVNSENFRFMKLTITEGYHDGTESDFFVHAAEIGLY